MGVAEVECKRNFFGQALVIDSHVQKRAASARLGA